MNILAVDTAGKTAAVAVLRDDVLLYEAQCNNGLTHSETLLPMIDTALKAAGLTVDDLDVLGVTNGPGSFTGLRIGVATAKGLAWPEDKPCAPCSTLESMAWPLAFFRDAVIVCAMDARRSQIYNALFEIRGGKPVRLCEDRAISLAELGEELGKMQKSAFLVGDGAQLCYNTCLDMGIPAVLAPGNLVSQSAWGVAMAAFGQTPAPAEELLPVYLRLSQAERERQARLAAQAAQE